MLLVSIATHGEVTSPHQESTSDPSAPTRVDGSLEDVTRRITQTYFRHLAGHDTTGVYELFITQVERGLLGVVLEYTQGNQTRAAEILGINRGTLRKKLRSCELR